MTTTTTTNKVIQQLEYQLL